MMAIDRYGWMTVVAWGLAIWVGFAIALCLAWHRRKSGHWRPYTDEEVEDPDWDLKH